MNHLLVSIKIRCGEWEFSNKFDIIQRPFGISEEEAIKLHYSEGASQVDGDTYYYDNDCYCYTVVNWKDLTTEQHQVLQDLGVY